MSSQEGHERVAQKQRTRNALLAAARALMGEGRQPTVQEAADRAGISRATAYRYFSKPEAMAQEAVLDAIALQFEQLDLDAGTRTDPSARAEQVVVAVLTMVLKNEALFRAYLGAVGNTGGDGRQRGGRRLRWIAEALAPLSSQISAARFRRLVNALALLTGIETIVVLKDVCGLAEAEINRTARWIARSLVAATLAESSSKDV